MISFFTVAFVSEEHNVSMYSAVVAIVGANRCELSDRCDKCYMVVAT